MLLNLSIKNFILIESLNLEFSQGLYAVTGETGAGKSILVDAILFVIGEKFDSSVVRANAVCATVTAEFSMNKELTDLIQESGIDSSETILIKRQQYPDNKKKFFINDEPVSQKLITNIANHILEVHGQHSYSQLLNYGEHLKILDKFGNLENDKELLSKKFHEYQKLSSDLELINSNKNTLLQNIDYLSFVVQELQSKCPKKGEAERLASLRSNLQQNMKNQTVLKEMKEIFSVSNISGNISNMQKTINRTIKDDSFKEVTDNLEQVQIYLQEAEGAIYRLEQTQEIGDLDEIEERLFEIKDLARKYNIPSDELEDHLYKSENELSELQSKLENSDMLIVKLADIKAEYMALAKNLTAKRQQAAYGLEVKVKEELLPLKMEFCRLVVEIKQKNDEHISSNGMDDVRFVASTNPGMPLAPIDKIASGGEIARFMLAFKLALFDKFGAATIIFDEIDTGIGGSTADAIGERLYFLSRVSQTIVITHQPQVAAKADYNILVSKVTDGFDTASSAKILTKEEKKSEIARMLSGAKITEKSVAAAIELMND